ncbi:TetR family transcriptional regulator [Microbacterium thalli]|uniref:TetR family transcriptional regulator n=1 Tax=Microbacterium thalli TaxID=3027921 RepID=A0ABT5SGC7_9MICO|nr:TetR family transcriptional regulator [Microbacterium thalli]MDD7929250.1 TetR family transcriptional regulator [Microbacterium thalli]MDD7961834.1 TetR family transcriptional regulator [Microbacterium thalli]MDN8549236.1 TetR family transcriptional regulator [Microbacterium thalli]
MESDREDPLADTPPTGLRERRRLETQRELSDAALELFEERGVHGTTVDDIARRAGTSQRTFFRYFPTKEAAVFASADDSARVVSDAIEAVRAGASVVEGIELSWLNLLERFDAHPDEHIRALRVRRIVGAEPSLLALALRNEAEQVEQLTDAAVDAAGADADVIASRAAVSTLALVLRLTIDEWVRRAELNERASVREIYLEMRRGVAAIARDLEGAPPTYR